MSDIDTAIRQATSSRRTAADWDLNLEICDFVNQHPGRCAPHAEAGVLSCDRAGDPVLERALLRTPPRVLDHSNPPLRLVLQRVALHALAGGAPAAQGAAGRLFLPHGANSLSATASELRHRAARRSVARKCKSPWNHPRPSCLRACGRSHRPPLNLLLGRRSCSRRSCGTVAIRSSPWQPTRTSFTFSAISRRAATCVPKRRAGFSGDGISAPQRARSTSSPIFLSCAGP